jgi:hypothetical protein
MKVDQQNSACPECGEHAICDTCARLFDEEVEALYYMDIEAQAREAIQKINIGSGEDVCLS